ncbi:MAG: hypothetical protein JO099_25000 [Acidobacteriia bacterium]|nr:hypothetical protein [Terriglobia bacterium]
MKSVFLLLSTGIVALANTISCPVATLDSYLATIDGPGCSVGSLVFNDFQYQTFSSGGNIPVPLDQVLVTPLSDSHGVGFDFHFTGLTATQDQNDAEIEFIGESSSANPFNDIYAAMTGTTSGPAEDILTEDFCPSGSPGLPPDPACALAAGPIRLVDLGGVSAETEFFAPTTGIAVLKDVQAFSCPPGQLCGTATILDVVDQVDINPTPEPGFYGVLGIGLGTIIIANWRRKMKAHEIIPPLNNFPEGRSRNPELSER